ncbi:hypothetical protein Hsw_2625 [Hymenobacter swuensis DY53]|uniref:Uncharacterized protein n=1 Tax=Hymenobacter swuensis DY53 TaxID=1227739 RepID=W8F913_9BACT|nr:hypothetical protein Hsw_2625 [Hymenobacter swuensis DY53]
MWAGGFVLLALFLGFMAFVLRVGKRDFVDRAATAEGKERRLLLLILLAPFFALFILYTLLVGF